MDAGEDSSRFAPRPSTASRNLSSSSSAFFSANQSPFFSPRSPTCQDHQHATSMFIDPLNAFLRIAYLESLRNVTFALPDAYPIAAASCPPIDLQKLEQVSSSTCISDCRLSSFVRGQQYRENDYMRPIVKQKKLGKMNETSVNSTSTSSCSNRLRSCDVYIGFHGRKPLLQRFTHWLRAELEAQGLSCFVTDRARCRNSR